MSTEFINDQWRLPNAWNGSESNVNKQSNYSMDFDSAAPDEIKTGVISLSEDFTISIWTKWNNSVIYHYLWDFRDQSASNPALYLYNNTLYLYISGTVFSSSSITQDGNTWYNIVLVKSGNTYTAYKNGSSLVSGTNSTSFTNSEMTIGNRSTSVGTTGLDGSIDAVSIFNYALSASQITTLYGSSSTGIGNPMSLSPKPVAYYPLGDQDAFNGSNYLVPNSSLKDYVFDFDSDYIEVPNSTDFDFGTNDFTISSWVNTTGTTTQHRTVVSKQNPAISGQWSFQVLTDGRVNFYGNNGGIDVLSTTTINDGNWHNIIIQRTGNIFNLYIDKVLADQLTASGQNITNTQVLRIGRRLTTYNGYFDGKISNVQFFNTALPATGSNSVETLYNNGSPLTSMSGFTSLQGWWKLDASATYDGSNWTIPDDSSNSNTGTSSGMTQANLVQSDLSFTSGYSPYALNFDGANDYIDCGTGLGDSLGTYTGDLTLSYWFNTNSLTANDGIFTIGSFSNTQGEFQVNIYNNNMLFRVDSGNQRKTLSISSLSTGTWYHIGFIYKSGDISNSKVYLNGAEQSTTDLGTFPSSLSFSGLKTILGGYYGTGNTFDGSISNVSIWNAALTSAQVTELYSEGIPQNLNNHSAVSSLVSWWQLGSNSSFNTNWTVLDEKGSNNGTSSNMTEDAIVDGVGSYANGLSSGMGGDEIVGNAFGSSANSLSINMDVLDRVTDTPS